MWRKNIKYIAPLLIVVFIVLALLVWGVAVEPRLVDFKEEIAVIPNLPEAWENKRIALIADLQIGMWMGNEDTVKKIVDRIITIRPAAVLIAGDFVYKPTDEDEQDDIEREDVRNFMTEINDSVALVQPLVAAGIPTYAVLGNHDYGMKSPNSIKNDRLVNAVSESLEAAGVRMLRNSAAEVQISPTQAIYIVGLDSLYAENAKPIMALSQLPDDAPRIIFMHNPDSFAEFPANAAPLALAGHTHGGQIRIPFTDDWSWMALISDEKIKADGWIKEVGQPGNHLYVNRGIGFSSFPIRINCRPELTIFTLRNGKD